MADLTTTVQEVVTLNGSLRGSTNAVTTTGINDVFERIVTCAHSQTTTIGVFAASPHTSPGAIDVDRTKYIRVTNLDTVSEIELAVVTTDSNYQVLLTPGHSHILCKAEGVVRAEEDQAPDFGGLQNLISLIIKPVGVSFDPQVSIMIAGV